MHYDHNTYLLGLLNGQIMVHTYSDVRSGVERFANFAPQGGE